LAQLIMQQDGDWVALHATNNKQFVDFLKYSVKPISYRKYNAEEHYWLIHWSQLRTVSTAARKYFSHVDWSTLPTEWQMFLVGAEIPVASELVPVENPFPILFLTEDAPMEVVRAAYKALAGIHHPDHGGSENHMAELNRAYAAICELHTR